MHSLQITYPKNSRSCEKRVLGVKSAILSSLQHFTTFVFSLNVWKATFDKV